MNDELESSEVKFSCHMSAPVHFFSDEKTNQKNHRRNLFQLKAISLRLKGIKILYFLIIKTLVAIKHF
jgi:hypothetical protein